MEITQDLIELALYYELPEYFLDGERELVSSDYRSIKATFIFEIDEKHFDVYKYDDDTYSVEVEYRVADVETNKPLREWEEIDKEEYHHIYAFFDKSDFAECKTRQDIAGVLYKKLDK